MFELSDLCKFNEPRQLLEFSDKFFSSVGGGTSRGVYSINSKYVIKVARSEYGIWQNESEIRATHSESNNGLILPLHRYDINKALWVVQRKAQPIGENNLKLFDTIYGLSFQDVCNQICNIQSGKELDAKYADNHFVKLLNDFISKQETRFFHDLKKMDSYGFLDEKIYLIDYGMDNETFELYLHGKGGNMCGH